jgi:hypothetical protein
MANNIIDCAERFGGKTAAIRREGVKWLANAKPGSRLVLCRRDGEVLIVHKDHPPKTINSRTDPQQYRHAAMKLKNIAILPQGTERRSTRD